MEWFGNIEYERIQCHHTRNENPNPADFHMHTHTEYELYYFICGCGQYRVEGHTYPLEAGDVILMRTAETHSLQISPCRPYERVAVHFYPELLSEPMRSRLLRPFTERPLGEQNRYASAELSGLFIRQCLEKIFLRPDAGENFLLIYLLPVLEEVAEAFDRRCSRQQPAVPQPLSARMVAYVNLHLAELDNLCQLEKEFFLSRSQINRIFRRATGTSAWDYIQIKRLFSARQMLFEGTAPSQAAQACGYREYSTFYRAYKKRFSHSPQQDLGLRPPPGTPA